MRVHRCATARARIVLLWLLSLPAGAVHAQQAGAGVGAFVGNAAGIAGKRWVNDRYAVAGGLGMSLEQGHALHLHADYLLHSAEAPQKVAYFRGLGGDGLVLVYYGAGVRLLLVDVNRLGARATAGLLYADGAAPWDAFVEVVPVLDVVPHSDWSMAAYVGWRWYLDGARRSPPGPRFRLGSGGRP